MFISLAKEGTITGAAIFNILVLILSNPATLEPFIECRFTNIKLLSAGRIQKFTALGFLEETKLFTNIEFLLRLQRS